VAAEGKKLSPKSETALPPHRQTGFRLHYFPDIPVDDRDTVRTCAPLEDKFQRIRYDHNGAACASISSAFDPGPGRPAEGPLVDKRDVQAYQKGYCDGVAKGLAEGEKAGFESAAKKNEPILKSFQEALLQLQNLRQETYQRIEMEVVDLALAIARKVICREVEVDREVVVCVAREALAKIEDPGKIKIKMNPSDLEYLEETKYQLSDMMAQIDNATLIAEDSIQSGGCVIETNSGEIDARIEAQIQAIEETFRNAIKKSVKTV
jgi:flagellar biosynthesis/type III secretory pathway protein FliH